MAGLPGSEQAGTARERNHKSKKREGWGGDAGAGDCKHTQGEKPQRHKETRKELSVVLMTFYKQKTPLATFTQKESEKETFLE